VVKKNKEQNSKKGEGISDNTVRFLNCVNKAGEHILIDVLNIVKFKVNELTVYCNSDDYEGYNDGYTFNSNIDALLKRIFPKYEILNEESGGGISSDALTTIM